MMMNVMMNVMMLMMIVMSFLSIVIIRSSRNVLPNIKKNVLLD